MRARGKVKILKAVFPYGVLEEDLFLNIPEGYEEFLKKEFKEELKGAIGI